MGFSLPGIAKGVLHKFVNLMQHPFIPQIRNLIKQLFYFNFYLAFCFHIVCHFLIN